MLHPVSMSLSLPTDGTGETQASLLQTPVLLFAFSESFQEFSHQHIKQTGSANQKRQGFNVLR